MTNETRPLYYIGFILAVLIATYAFMWGLRGPVTPSVVTSAPRAAQEGAAELGPNNWALDAKIKALGARVDQLEAKLNEHTAPPKYSYPAEDPGQQEGGRFDPRNPRKKP